MLGEKTKIEVLIMAAGASSRLGQPKQRLEYKEIGGFAKLQIDKVKGQIEAVYTIAGAMTGKGMSYISKLKGKNLKVAENLANFLFE